ncbi:MAG: outer membrane beta-barrel protein [Muribaculaceae bacterium]|nr:outer membrane beta-barrel protein [Muribaculaceae bacterium]
MKKTFITLLVLLSTLVARADIGEFALGTQATYGTHGKAMAVGVSLKYNFFYHWRINLLADYYFKKDGVWSTDFAMEHDYLIYLGEKVRLFPLAGLGLQSDHSTYETLAGPETDVDQHMTAFCGLGVEYLIGDHLTLDFKSRCHYNGEDTQGLFSIGASWRF